MSIYSHWPKDRLDLLAQCRVHARKLGLNVSVKNAGMRMLPMYKLTLSKAKTGEFVASYFDVADLELRLSRLAAKQ